MCSAVRAELRALQTDVLGCSQTPAKTDASGNGLFTPGVHPWRIAHSYMDFALLLDNLMVVKRASGNVDVLREQLEAVKRYKLQPTVNPSVLEELSRLNK